MRRHVMRWICSCLLWAAAASPLPAQEGSARSVRGRVVSPVGKPMPSVNVFIKGTLDGAVTDTAGTFRFETARTGPLVLVAQHGRFQPVEVTVAATGDVDAVVRLAPSVLLDTLQVASAGSYTAGGERGATLSNLEVFQTPGAGASVARTVQTLPGVQQADEGTGVFIRGGDYTETRTFLDGATYLSTQQFEAPTGSAVNSVSAFSVSDIFFSSGGFSARYGNALSGLIALRTRGRATRSTATLTAGISGVSGSVARSLPRGFGVDVTASLSDSRYLLQLNGNPANIGPAPQGYGVSGSAAWEYRPSGEIKVFAESKGGTFGVRLDEANFQGSYRASSANAAAVAQWSERIAGTSLSATAAWGSLHREERIGVLEVESTLQPASLVFTAERLVRGNILLQAGGEIERTGSEFDGRIPEEWFDRDTTARARILTVDTAAVYQALFGEADVQLSDALRVKVGLRTDRSTATGVRTYDPRTSLSFSLGRGATLIGAWGIFHQVPSPNLIALSAGRARVRPMRAEHRILGVHYEGEGNTMLRGELFWKRYADLTQLSRNREPVPGGEGLSRGADLIAKHPLPLKMNGRLTYSFVKSERTEPNTGTVVRAPFDVTHGATAVVDRPWGTSLLTSVAYRYSTGRPFTPVVGATLDPVQQVYIPEFGAPMGERLPAFRRVDVNLTHVRSLGPSLRGVFLVQVQNVFNTRSVFRYTYSPDYRERRPAPSVLDRMIYFGASITHD